MYKTCRELPLHNFIEIQATNDLTHLLQSKEEKVEDEILSQTWIEIVDEFYRIMNNGVNPEINKDFEYLKLQMKVLNLEIVKKVLELDLEKGKELARKVKVNYLKVDEYLKTALMRLSIFEKKNVKKDIEFNPYDYDDSIANLMRMGFVIQRKSTTVSEYCSIIKSAERLARANNSK